MPRPVVRTVKLCEPLHVAGEEIHELEILKPRSKTIRLVAEAAERSGEAVAGFVALEDLTGLPLEILDELDFDDAQDALAVVAELLQKKRKRATGPRASKS